MDAFLTRWEPPRTLTPPVKSKLPYSAFSITAGIDGHGETKLKRRHRACKHIYQYLMRSVALKTKPSFKSQAVYPRGVTWGQSIHHSGEGRVGCEQVSSSAQGQSGRSAGSHDLDFHRMCKFSAVMFPLATKRGEVITSRGQTR